MAARTAFERYFADSRKSKGPSRQPTFAKLEDGTHADDHTQRHWWTWQQAVAAERDMAGMTNGELQMEIYNLQQLLIRRVYGDPSQGVSLTVSGWHSMCNCHQHKRGGSTGGWYCNAHGQQL